MAGSRYEKVGTIFSRVSGLLRSGVMKDVDKPVWFEVYKAFPPKYEPRVDRPVPVDKINAILYQEDKIRARFYTKFGSPGGFNLTDESMKPLSQRFVEKYIELDTQKDFMDDEIFEATVQYFASLGIELLEEQKIGLHVKVNINDNEDLLVPPAATVFNTAERTKE